jgi:hypothetical protein
MLPHGMDFVFDFLQHRDVLLSRVKREGYRALSGHDFFLAVAEEFFSEFGTGARDDIRGRLYDCCEDIIDSVLSARAIKDNLKRILFELDYIRKAQRPKRGPLPSRTISAGTLSVIAGRLPEELKPQFDDESLLREFASVSAVTVGPSDVAREAFITSPRSELLPGTLYFHSANNNLVGFGRNTGPIWPASLAALGFAPFLPIDRGVSIRQVLDLPRRDQVEIRKLCASARKQLKLVFGIKRTRDPLRINAASLFFRPPMARLLGCLCEIIAPFPKLADANDYRLIYTGRPQVDGLDLYSVIFEYLERRIECKIKHRIGSKLKYILKFVGLLDNRDADNSECVRFIERFITCHRQIALLHAVRLRAVAALGKIDVTSKARIIVPGTNGCAVGWPDYHNLGHWTDVLRGRLELGLVDTGRDEKLRYRLPGHVHWQWPPHAAMTQTVEGLISPLVQSARRTGKIR